MSEQAHDAPAAAVPPRRPRVLLFLAIAICLFVALSVLGIRSRHEADTELAQWTKQRSIPSVSVVSPKAPTQTEHLTLPADVEAFYTAPIHARVNGYVKMWYYDIGARVKAGTVLARIDTPDLDQQFAQAKGELAKAQADYNLAVITADRWKSLRSSQAVSQQAADEKEGDALARKAQVTAAQANVDRLVAMESFKDITAPFDGIVTARRIDVGALVLATNANQPGLFDVAATRQMRVYVRVPQVFSSKMKKGMRVSLQLPQYPSKTFEGRLDATSDAISREARSLLVQVGFDNAEGLLSPGSYGEATFDLPLDPTKLVIPASAMIFRGENPEVALVRDDHLHLQKIDVLVDLGAELEVGGLSDEDLVVVNPPDSAETGDQVRVETINGERVKTSQSTFGREARR